MEPFCIDENYIKESERETFQFLEHTLDWFRHALKFSPFEIKIVF